MYDLNKLILCQNLTAKTLAIETLKFSTEPEIDRLIHLLCKLNTDKLIIASEGDHLFDAFERQQYFFNQLEEKNKVLIIRENSNLWPQPQPEEPHPFNFQRNNRLFKFRWNWDRFYCYSSYNGSFQTY